MEELELKKQLNARDKLIAKYRPSEINYFDIENYIDLEKYSTYIFITPRNIGKSYSTFKHIIDVYELTGEYTVWARTSETEFKEMMRDYKSNRPKTWKDTYKLEGNHLIDVQTNRVVIKFVALTTVHNLASITGDGCYAFVYDEFLRRTSRKLTVDIYNVIVDFFKTIERKSLLTVIMIANFTTLDNEILQMWDIWDDTTEMDLPKDRFRFRLIKEWENPPDVQEIGTTKIWAKKSPKLKAFMENAEVLDNSKNMVVPESRYKDSWTNYEWFFLNGIYLSYSVNVDGQHVIRQRDKLNNGAYAYDLTTEDGFNRKGNHIRPYDINNVMQKYYNMLESNMLTFTTHKAKNEFIDYLIRLKGKIIRKL